jgi:Nitrate reductase alpha subunit
MKTVVQLLFLILSLAGCSSKAEVAEEYRYWSYGFTAPPYFQIKTEYLQASMPDGHTISLMAGPSEGGYRPGDNTGYDLSPGFSSSMDQHRYIELPDSMVVNWFSYAEKQFYAANIHFSPGIKKQMMTPFKSNCLGVQEMRYHNDIVIGLAPGGYVKVWGTGGCGDKDILVGKFKGWKMVESLTGTRPEHLKESTEDYHQRFADILAKPIPYEKWK